MMLSTKSALSFVFVFGVIGSTTRSERCGEITATAIAHLTVGRVRGSVMFVEYKHCPTWIFGSLSNIPKDGGPLKGFHVHTLPDFSNGCDSTGGHYNPKNATHGGPKSLMRHVGDMGNIKACPNCSAAFSKQDSIIKLTGPNGVVGRPVVIHMNMDDLGQGGNSASKVNGNAGARVGCGLIQQLCSP